MNKYALVQLLLLSTTPTAFAQGFVNLNFESANIAGYGTGSIPASNAIPGWTAYIGGTQETNILLGGSSLIGVNLIASTNLQGNYYVLLQGAASMNEPASIGQTGTVPTWAQSLIWWGAGPDSLSFNGQALSFESIGSGLHYGIYAANISAFAGETGQLLFTSIYFPATPGDIIDNIQFSASPVPEPGSVSLFALGCIAVGFSGLGRKARRELT